MGTTPTFGNALHNKPFVSAVSDRTTTDQLLLNRFSFYSTLLRNYVKYSHEAESMSRSSIEDRVMPIANTLIEKYKFGSMFMTDLQKYIASRFQKPASKVYEEMRTEAGLPDGVFETMVADLQSSNLVDSFSSKFRLILK